MAKKPAKAKNNNGVTLNIENELWESADKMRGHLDAAEYKSVVLGLIFLKYISDIFDLKVIWELWEFPIPLPLQKEKMLSILFLPQRKEIWG